MLTGDGAPQPEREDAPSETGPRPADRRIGRRQFLLLLAGGAILLAAGVATNNILSSSNVGDGAAPSGAVATASPQSGSAAILDSSGKPILDSSGREISGR